MNFATEYFFEEDIDYRDNIFIGGADVENGTLTTSFVSDNITASFRNLRIENNIIKGYAYKNNGSNLVVGQHTFSDYDLDFFMFNNNGFFNFNNTDGFEFRNAVLNYVWMPNLLNSLGRQSLQSTRWFKRAYFPYVLDLGRRTIYSNTISTTPYDLIIYAPSATSIQSDTFNFNSNATSGKFSHATLYLDYNIWNGVTDNIGLNSYIDSNGTVVLITDYTKPTKPDNLQVSNITSSSVDITFDASTFSNAFNFYEVFAVDENNPISKYFYHQEIKTNINSTITATITGLIPDTNYVIKVRAADEYYNLSNFSNQILFKTLT